MFKLEILFVVLCAVYVANSLPVRRNGMIYYQQSAPLVRMFPGQQAMYVRYQNQVLKPNRRSSGVAAYAAGNQVATGTYLKDCKNSESDSNEQAIPENEVQSFADAYPAAEGDAEQENDVPEQDALIPVEAPSAEEEIVNDEVESPVPAITTDKKKKVKVQLESAEDDEEDYKPLRNKKPSNGGSLPASFFPINFGSTNGGAIAIANAYSTGKGGSATSHATAYGSPTTESKKRANLKASLKSRL